MSKRIAVVQSNYIPWKGYFDLINLVDEFVLFDDVQYTRRDWRNRNRIKTPQGAQWLSIPVNSKGNYLALIKDIQIDEPDWNVRHWKTLCAHYGKAPFFRTYQSCFEDLYLGVSDTDLSAVNYRFISAICRLLGIGTTLRWSMDYPRDPSLEKTDRLVAICQAAGATSYLSGPTARAYIEPEAFQKANIELHFMDYSGYREYDQLYPPFDHGVTVLDLMFNQGPRATDFMLSFGPPRLDPVAATAPMVV